MNNYKIFSAILITLGLTTGAFAADNGITKEDIKRLQVNAFTEDLQQEMENSARSELKSSVKPAEFEMQAESGMAGADEQAAPAPPAISSR